MKATRLLGASLTLVAVLGMSSLLAGCNGETETEEAVEETGEAVEETGEEAADTVEDATD